MEPQSPQCQSTSTTNTNEIVLAPKCTDTLVPSMKEEQKEDDTENNSEDDFETVYALDNTLDNIV